MTKTRNLCFAVVAATLMSATSWATTWTESGDAPDGVPGRQDTVGVGPLLSISGRLDRAGGDHVDTYSILITDPSAFLASTKTAFGGSALTPTGGNGDTRLWLWDNAGGPVLANDDVNTPALGTDTLASLISDPSTFTALSGGEVVAPTAIGIALQPGKYLLSISEFANDPDGAGGVDMFLLGSDFDALHGPNTAAGPFVAWENAADTTVFDYTIALRGATFCVPEPSSLALIALGVLSLLAARWRG